MIQQNHPSCPTDDPVSQGIEVNWTRAGFPLKKFAEDATVFVSHNLYHVDMISALTSGGAWQILEGLREGQTQVDNPQNHNTAIFAHPIDIHFATEGMHGTDYDHLSRHLPFCV